MPADGAKPTPPERHEDRSGRKNWPPKDPPMFWVTFFTFVAISAYTVLTKEQINEARKNDIEQNRPYLSFVGIQPTGIVNDEGIPQSVALSPQFTNFGNTPAVDTIPRICAPIVRYDDSVPNFVCDQPDRVNPGVVFGPRMSHTIKGTSISIEDLKGTASGHEFVYAFGEIDYADDIGGRGGYRTRFCEQLVLQPQALQTGPPGLSRYLEAPCQNADWNCVDNNCASK